MPRFTIDIPKNPSSNSSHNGQSRDPADIQASSGARQGAQNSVYFSGSSQWECETFSESKENLESTVFLKAQAQVTDNNKNLESVCTIKSSVHRRIEWNRTSDGASKNIEGSLELLLKDDGLLNSDCSRESKQEIVVGCFDAASTRVDEKKPRSHTIRRGDGFSKAKSNDEKQEKFMYNSMIYSLHILSEIEKQLGGIATLNNNIQCFFPLITKFLQKHLEAKGKFASYRMVEQEKDPVGIEDQGAFGLGALGLFEQETEGLLELDTEAGVSELGASASVSEIVDRTGIPLRVEEPNDIEEFIPLDFCGYRLEDLDIHLSECPKEEKSGENNSIDTQEMEYLFVIDRNQKLKDVLLRRGSAVLSVQERELAEYYLGTDWSAAEDCLSLLQALMENIIMEGIDFGFYLNNILNGVTSISSMYLLKVIKNIIMDSDGKISSFNIKAKDNFPNRRKDLTALVEQIGEEGGLERESDIDYILELKKKHEDRLSIIFKCLDEHFKVFPMKDIYWAVMAIDNSKIPGSKEMIKNFISGCSTKEDLAEVFSILLNRFYLGLKSLQDLCKEVCQSNVEQNIGEEFSEGMKKIIREQEERLRGGFLRSKRKFRDMNLQETKKLLEVLKNLLSMFEKICSDGSVCIETVADMKEFMQESMQAESMPEESMPEESMQAESMQAESMQAERKEVSEEELKTKKPKDLCGLIVQFMAYFKENRAIVDEVYPELGNICDLIEYLLNHEPDVGMQILCGREMKMFSIDLDMILCYFMATKNEQPTLQNVFRALMSELKDRLYQKDNTLEVSKLLCDQKPLAFRKYENILKGNYAKILDEYKVLGLVNNKEFFYEVWVKQKSCVQRLFIYQLLMSEEEVSKPWMQLWSIWQARDISYGKESALENDLLTIAKEILEKVCQKGEKDLFTEICSLLSELTDSVANRKANPPTHVQYIMHTWMDHIGIIKKLSDKLATNTSLVVVRVIKCLEIFYSVDKIPLMKFFKNLVGIDHFPVTDNRNLEIIFLSVLLDFYYPILYSTDFKFIYKSLFMVFMKNIEKCLLEDKPLHQQEIALVRDWLESNRKRVCLLKFRFSKIKSSESMNQQTLSTLREDNYNQVVAKMLLFYCFGIKESIDTDFFLYCNESYYTKKPYDLLKKILSREVKLVLSSLEGRLRHESQEHVEKLDDDGRAILQNAINLYQVIWSHTEYDDTSRGRWDTRLSICKARQMHELISFCMQHKTILGEQILRPIEILRTVMGETEREQDGNLCYDHISYLKRSGTLNECSDAIFSFYCYIVFVSERKCSNLSELNYPSWTQQDFSFFWKMAKPIYRENFIFVDGALDVIKEFVTTKCGDLRRINDSALELVSLDALNRVLDEFTVKNIILFTRNILCERSYLHIAFPFKNNIIGCVNRILKLEYNSFRMEIEEETIFIFKEMLSLLSVVLNEKIVSEEAQNCKLYVWKHYKFVALIAFFDIIVKNKKFISTDKSKTICFEKVIEKKNQWLLLFFESIGYNVNLIREQTFRRDIFLSILGNCFYKYMNSECYSTNKEFWLNLLALRVHNSLSADEKIIFFNGILDEMLKNSDKNIWFQEVDNNVLLHWLKNNVTDKYEIEYEITEPMDKILFSCYFLNEEEFEAWIQKNSMTQDTEKCVRLERNHFLGAAQGTHIQEYSAKDRFQRIVSLKNISAQVGSSCKYNSMVQKYVQYSEKDVISIFGERKNIPEAGTEAGIELQKKFIEFYQKAWGNNIEHVEIFARLLLKDGDGALSKIKDRLRSMIDNINTSDIISSEYKGLTPKNIFSFIDFLRENENNLDDRLLTPLWIIDVMLKGDLHTVLKIIKNDCSSSGWMTFFCALYVLHKHNIMITADMIRQSKKRDVSPRSVSIKRLNARLGSR